MNLQQCLAFQVGVCYLQVHLVGLLVGAGLFLCLQLLFFLLQLHLTDIAHENGGTDNAQHTERVCAGIGRGDGRR